MNELSVTEEETFRGLLQLGWSHRRVARETGHHRATIQRVSSAMAIVAPGDEPKPATDSKVATDPEAAPRLPAAASEMPIAGARARDDFGVGVVWSPVAGKGQRPSSIYARGVSFHCRPPNRTSPTRSSSGAPKKRWQASASTPDTKR
jgi:hypothetical protein